MGNSEEELKVHKMYRKCSKMCVQTERSIEKIYERRRVKNNPSLSVYKKRENLTSTWGSG
jgi:hypothetical protein